MESQYNVVEVDTLSGEPRLTIHMVSRASQRDIPIRLMKLYGSEVKLNGGRFHAHDSTIVTLPVYVGRIVRANMQQAFINLVEWIADNAEGRWNFHLFYEESKAACCLTFYFDDVSDAVLFRLSIQHKSM